MPSNPGSSTLQFEKQAKPSTLSGYRSLLAKPKDKRVKRGARIMREFGGRKLDSITTKDIRSFLAGLDREAISARTVNIHRQVLHSIFEHARREDVFGLRDNPVAGIAKRPEEGPRPIETFEPEEIRAVADAARAGLHRGQGGYKHSIYSRETQRAWVRINEQDAALFLVAGCTGLRARRASRPALVRRRPRGAHPDGLAINVSRRGVEHQVMAPSLRASCRPSRSRAVCTSKASLLQSPNRLRLCRPDGGPLDRSAVRSRFVCAQEKAGVRVRRFHDLRHSFGSLAIQKFDLVAVKDMMGHSKLTTTERYLHSKPRPDDVAKLTKAFE
jgi:integrase